MNSLETAEPARLIWATRGQAWGFRFLRDGGFADPLSAYEHAFSNVADQPQAWHRDSTSVALRFTDPEQRADEAGRVILHEFVVFGTLADQIHSLEEGEQIIWPLVADEYRRIWSMDAPPSEAQ